jgi:signal transduction histidine kinase
VKGAVGDTLFAVLKAKRELLIACWSAKIRAAVSAPLTTAELLDHIPSFVDEIIAALYPGALSLPSSSAHASEHGAQRLRLRFDVSEVVREYGLLHECIVEVAQESGLQLTNAEERVVVGWLTAGIADALDQYVRRRDEEVERETSEHLGFIAHELRNPLSAARVAVQRLRNDELLAGGRTVELLERSLRRMADLIDNALSHASLKLGADPRREPVVVGEVLRDIELDANVDAQARGIDLVIDGPDEPVTWSADPRMLRSAIYNLVHNALKFSPAGSHVTVTARAGDDELAIDVADACGGLPAGRIDDLFAPLVQRGANRTGFGLGLSIARQAVEAHHGRISVRNVPGSGCVFSIHLPQPDAPGNPEPRPRIER